MDACASLVGELREIFEEVAASATKVPVRRMAGAVRASLLRCWPAGLPPEATTTSVERYGRHVLHREPGGRFSVVALALAPGQSTAIHDHTTWGVVAVLGGRQREVHYHFEGNGPTLIEEGTSFNEEGEVALVLPPFDVHRIEGACPHGGVTLSLHVYAGDESEVVNRTYELQAPAPVPVAAARGLDLRLVPGRIGTAIGR